MKNGIGCILLLCALVGACPAKSQVKMTRDQMLFYTSDWKGDRFPDGRPKLPDSLLKRAVDMSIEDVWDFLRAHGYQNQFESGWQALHIEKPFAGRALTAQYMPIRPDMAKAIAAEGKAEGRVGGTNMWPISELQIGDVYVADGFGKIIEGTLIGSNLGNGIAAHTHTGFVFDAGIRDQEENREIPDFNGFYRGYDPSAWAQMELTSINAPIRVGRATVLPGDVVLANKWGVIFIPAYLVQEVVITSEVTELRDEFGHQRLREKKYLTGQIDSQWTEDIKKDFLDWLNHYPGKLPMSKKELDDYLKERNY